MNNCHCVFPSPTEEELVTIPGEQPGTAIRVLVETSSEGYVRLQHLAHTEGLGWYVQKSMVVPRDVLNILIPQLRRAECLMAPRGASRMSNDAPPLRLVQPPEPDDHDTPLKRCGS